MKYYCEDAAAVLKEVGSSESGLSSEEAVKRLERDGRNELAAEKKDSLIKRFFAQMLGSDDHYPAGCSSDQRGAGGRGGRKLCGRGDHSLRRNRQCGARRISGEQGGESDRSPAGDERCHQQGDARRKDHHCALCGAGGRRYRAARSGGRCPRGRAYHRKRQLTDRGGGADGRKRPGL